MSDLYSGVRSIPFQVLAQVLGIDMARFKRRGQNYQGYCPIHQGKSNNCFSYHDSGKYHCFNCEAKGGGGIDLYKAVKGVGFKEAVEALTGVQSSTPIVQPEPNSCVLRPLEKDTWKKFQVPCEWLEKRIPSQEVRERYGVFAYNNPARKSAYSGRVMIPVKDVEGRLYGYLGRDTQEQSPANDQCNRPPKYLFPKNVPKSHFLFGAYELSEARPHRILYLVESPFCVLKFALYGLPAVSPYGWSVSPEQIQLLKQVTRGVLYLPDSNKRESAPPVLAALGEALWIKFPRLPDGIDDPEHLDREQIVAL